MARIAGVYRIHSTTTEGGEYVFNTVAESPAAAERIFRKLNRYWKRPIRIEGPTGEKEQIAPRPPKRTRRKK